MTEPASDESEPRSPRRGRTSRLHPTGLVVAVGGVALTIVAATLTFLEIQNREDETLAEVAEDLAEDVDTEFAQLDAVLSGVRGGILATGEANQQDLERVVGTRVEDSRILGGAMVVIAEPGQGSELYVEAGRSLYLGFLDPEQPPLDPDVAAERIDALSASPAEDLEILFTEESADPETGETIFHVGVATKVSTADGEDFVLYLELATPESVFAELAEGEPGRPDFAVYLGTSEDPDQLLLSPTGAPLSGESVTRPFTIGEQDGLLVVSPTTEILSESERLVPLLVVLAGLALTAVLTPLVNRLARRREEVRMLSAQRDELDHALAVSREIERELRASEQRFRSVLHSSPDVVLWMDLDTTGVQVLNRDDLLGHPLERVTTTEALLELVHPDDRQLAEEGFRALWHSEPGAITEVECRVLRADDEAEWLRIRGGRVELAEGEDAYLLAVLTNVTEQKSEEARRAALEAQLVQSQRLEAVGQLAGGVAHDFNNILAAIVSGAELVLDEVDGQAREDVEEIQRTARRGSDLARQLLLFSRRDRGSSPEVVDVNTVIADVQTMLGRTIDETVELRTDLDPDLDRVLIDPSQVERVLMNLTINARDAMPDGGTITIETRNVEADDEMAATRPDVEPGPYVELRISDTGEGMPEEVRQRCFEPFYSTKEAGKGTGLGLATVYGVVQGAQGHIEIESEIGVGTTFVMWFPRSRIDLRGDEDGEREKALEGGNERVLLVEDDPGVRGPTRRLLEKRGYGVTAAADGQEAAELADQEFDLVLTDVVMPGGMNGREVATMMREHQPRIAVLYMTGHTDDVLEGVGIDDGEEEALIVRKPFSEEQLLRAMRLALSRVMEPTS